MRGEHVVAILTLTRRAEHQNSCFLAIGVSPRPAKALPKIGAGTIAADIGIRACHQRAPIDSSVMLSYFVAGLDQKSP